MGFEKVVTAPGHGPKPVAGQNVTVHWCAVFPAEEALSCAAHTVLWNRSTGYGKNRDLAVPFWSTKDAGQKPFSFVIGPCCKLVHVLLAVCSPPPAVRSLPCSSRAWQRHQGLGRGRRHHAAGREG